jgi:hypothetical protein
MHFVHEKPNPVRRPSVARSSHAVHVCRILLPAFLARTASPGISALAASTDLCLPLSRRALILISQPTSTHALGRATQDRRQALN